MRTPEQAARGELGTKVEVKNLNSLRAVRSAIAYEAERQAEVLESGGVIEQVNMGWDENRQRNRSAAFEGEQRGLPLLPGTGSAAAGGRPAVGGGGGRAPCPNCRTPRSSATGRRGPCGRQMQAPSPARRRWLTIFEAAVAAYGQGGWQTAAHGQLDHR